jgi:CRISPR-associated protein Cas1
VSLYGSVSVSPDALAALVEHGAHVVWLSPNGLRLRARVTPAADSALLLRLGQYQLYVEPLRRLRLAVSIVQQRIATLGALLRHWQRHAHPDAGALRQQLLDLHRNAQRCRSLDKLRGLEGLATARFFDAFAARLQPPWTFPGRRRRPPTDPVNALLSLTAMLLVRRALTRLQAEGLEPALGILHQFHPGRPSLACDVVEPLRAVFVEQFTLQACNQRWVAPHDFLPADPQLGVRLNHTAFPRLLARWEQYYLENSGPQRLGRIVSQIVRQLRGIRLPAPFNSVQPHQPEELPPRSSDAQSAADASDTQTSSTDTT